MSPRSGKQTHLAFLLAALVVAGSVLGLFAVVHAAPPAAVPPSRSPTFSPAVTSLVVSPTHGPVGTLLSFSASGFAASSSISIAWNQGTVCTGLTSSGGVFGCTYPIAASPEGAASFTATDSHSGTAVVAFTVNPALSATPNAGPAGTLVAFAGTGFAASSSIALTWVQGSACTTTSAANGSFDCSYAIPPTTPGAPYTFTATDASTNAANAPFAVTYIVPSPAAAKIGARVNFTGAGWAPSSPFWINWTGGNACSGTTTVSGALLCSFSFPALTAGGSYPFTGTDGVGDTDTANASVLPTLTSVPVNATPGSSVLFNGVGYAASSVVSVAWSGGPACANTSSAAGVFSCSYVLGAGFEGLHTFTGTDGNGGSATTKVRFGPALTVGPLNATVGSTVTFNGYGFLANGSASVNQGATTVCSATVDSIGSFVCSYVLTAGAAGPHLFTARDAGTKNATTNLTIVPSLSIRPGGSGTVGSRLTFSGSGFAKNSGVSVAWVEGTICSASANSLGSFSCSVLLPPAPTGNYSFNATDGASNSASSSFRVVPGLVITPPFGPSGTSVSLSATGFAGISPMTINGTGQTACAGTTSPAGSFSCTFTIPVASSGPHLFQALDGVGHVANATYTLVGPGVFSVTFKAVGLPAGSNWTVSAGFPSTTESNVTFGGSGKVRFFESNGSLPYSFTEPAGYGVAAVLGPNAPSQIAGNVSGATTFTVRFGPFENLTFNALGLPIGASWGVTISSALRYGGPSPQSATSTSPTINFTVVKDPYKFQIGPKPSTYRAAPGHGSVGVPAHAVSKTIKFKLVSEKVVFHRTGLVSGTLWGVNITGSGNYAANTTAGSLSFFLPNGTYTYTVWQVGSLFPHPGTGNLTIVAPNTALSVAIAYTATPVAASPTGGSSLAPLLPPLLGGLVVFVHLRWRSPP